MHNWQHEVAGMRGYRLEGIAIFVQFLLCETNEAWDGNGIWHDVCGFC